jgi:aspartyl-tRNA(Asn)/glutamyl-tRNA(Gln) amidotransferase subunit A
VHALDELTFAPIADVAARLHAGALSPVALAEHSLGRILSLGPALRAFITVTVDLAHTQARAAERELGAGRWRGPLHGVPVAVKDFYDTAGIRTTAGAEELTDRVPARDAALVVALRNAGAVLVGKTNMHRLGMGTTSLESLAGPVVNPWDARHVAGGSSGGSAAAVAAGLCFATVDTDAVGSGRLPAAICGVTCLKPTYGALSTEGILAGEPDPGPAIRWLSHPCVTARSAADATLAFEALAGAPAREPPPVRRLGVARDVVADDDLRARGDAAVARIAEALGVETRAVRVPFEVASFDVREIERDRAAADATLFAEVDAIALPTLSAPTPTVAAARAAGAQAVAPDLTLLWNYLGLPAITVPGGVDARGLPFGVQLVGARGADHRLLALARRAQEATGWRYAPPPLARPAHP